MSGDRISWEPESPQTAEGALTAPCPPAQASCPSLKIKIKMTLSGHQEKWRYNYTHAALAVQVLLNYYTKLDAQIWGL